MFMVSCCDQLMSVVLRLQFVLNGNSYTPGPISVNFLRNSLNGSAQVNKMVSILKIFSEFLLNQKSIDSKLLR